MSDFGIYTCRGCGNAIPLKTERQQKLYRTNRIDCADCRRDRREKTTILFSNFSPWSSESGSSAWDEYQKYKEKVWGLTEERPLALLDGHQQRGFEQKHLHHIVPVYVCFRNGVDPRLASSFENLRFIEAEDNLRRGYHTLSKRAWKLLRSWLDEIMYPKTDE